MVQPDPRPKNAQTRVNSNGLEIDRKRDRRGEIVFPGADASAGEIGRDLAPKPNRPSDVDLKPSAENARDLVLNGRRDDPENVASGRFSIELTDTDFEIGLEGIFFSQNGLNPGCPED